MSKAVKNKSRCEEQPVLPFEAKEQEQIEQMDLPGIGSEQGPVSSTLRHLFQMAHRTPCLSAEEERALGLRVLAGDMEAQHELVQRNIRLAVWMARKYDYYGVPLEERIQAGMLAMAAAVSKFDCTKNIRFSTFMYKRIQSELQALVGSCSSAVSCPPYWVAITRQVHAVYKDLTEQQGGVPASIEAVWLVVNPIWKKVNVTLKHVADILGHRSPLDQRLSLSQPLSNEDGEQRTRLDTTPDTRFVSAEARAMALSELSNLCRQVHILVRAIPKNQNRWRQVQVFTLHYGINSTNAPKTFKQIAGMPGFPNHYQSVQRTVKRLWKTLRRVTGVNQKVPKELLARIDALAEDLGVERKLLFRGYDIGSEPLSFVVDQFKKIYYNLLTIFNILSH